MRQSLFFRLALILSLMLSGCASGSGSRAMLTETSLWKPADLRWLGNLTTNTSPKDTLTAVYTRETSTELQIRLDYLDSLSPADNDIYLALDTQPGGATTLPDQPVSPLTWDQLILAPAQGEPLAFQSNMRTDPDLIPTVERDPLMDTAVIHLPLAHLTGNLHPFRLYVCVTAPENAIRLSSAGPLLSSDIVTATAPVLLSFWNTMPGATPAQTLRRWDGAHTGPLGQRHGLNQILTSSLQNHIPVALLDLKIPASLSALDTLGALPQIRRNLARGYLILPEVLWGDPSAAVESRRMSQKTAQAFGLPASTLLFGAGSPYPPSSAAFAELNDPTHLGKMGAQRLIPLPANIFDQNTNTLSNDVSPLGPGLSLRKALLQTALSPDPTDLLSLGGSLPDSLWGDSSIAPVVFAYMASHPWIHILNETDLFATGVKSDNPPRCDTLICLPNAQTAASPSLLTELRSAPQNQLTTSAWMLYLTLTQPESDPRLINLRNIYIGETGPIIKAAQWAENPHPMTDCTQDIDGDGASECILASSQVFTVLEPDGARLSFAFSKTKGSAVQWIGPASQFSVGLSDPSQWNFTAGISADPGEIPGISSTAWGNQVFLVQPIPEGIIFTSPDAAVRVSYTLQENGIRMEVHSSQPSHLRLPLAVDPSSRFSPQWAAHYLAGVESWGISNTARVMINTNGMLTITHFGESLAYLHELEDPNRSYPNGHYLPFPLAIAEVSSSSSLWITLQMSTVN